VNALLAGLLAGLLSWLVAPTHSDFSHVAAASRLFMLGGDPWAAVGPARAIPWPYPLYYPAPALLLVWPFAVIGSIGGAVFVGCSVAAMVWAMRRARVSAGAWFVLVSPAIWFTVFYQQWSAWLAAAALAPTVFGAVFAAKPTIGAAAWGRELRWRALAVPIALTLLAFAISPSWPFRWITAASSGVHPIPVMQLAGGGPLLLLAWLRWRDPDARLLGGLALVPQTMAPHECVILFLCCKRWWEGLGLSVLIGIAFVAAMFLKTGHTPPSFTTGGAQYIREQMAANGPVFTALVYLPCLGMMLRQRVNK
jgi:hypothetical protein